MSSTDTIFVMSDVQLPEETSGPKTRYPFETLEVGQLFFLPGRKASKFSPYAGKFGRRTGRRFQTRDIFMTKRMDGDRQVGWDLATSGDNGAVAGCAVKRLTDPAPVVDGNTPVTGNAPVTDDKPAAAATGGDTKAPAPKATEPAGKGHPAAAKK